MSTSLAEQLQRLTVPQSSIYKEDKKKPSLLFDPKEAAQKDKETFYEIGIRGLKELILIHEGFRFYSDTLFSPTSKDFERAVQTKEVNQNLDNTIEKFLKLLSPYLLIQSAHKAIEWLIHRYHIHEYNQDAIMALILPYHETKIFVRFIQIMDIKHSSNRWNWLQPLQKPGVMLTKQILHNQCVSNNATLQFITKNTWSYVVEYGERASHLTTLYAFFCSTVIGTIDSSKNIKESLINVILPTLMKALESPINDFRSCAYIILGYLMTKTNIKESTLKEIVEKLLTFEFDLSYDVILLTNLIYSTQLHIKKIPDNVLYDISVEKMMSICQYLKRLISNKINVQPFITTFLASILPLIQMDIEEFRRSCRLPEILIDELDLVRQHPEKIIKCVIESFNPLETKKECVDGNESDVEIIEEDFFSDEVIQWYSKFLKSLETKYPENFDDFIKKELNSGNKISTKRHSQLMKVLCFNPAVSHKVGDTYLFENLNHANPEMRVQAVNYITKEFSTLKAENIDFLKESIINRFNDDNPEVVKAALDFPIEYLSEVLTDINISNAFVNIMSRNTKNLAWQPVMNEAINKFCSLESLPLNQQVILTLMPHLLPKDENAKRTCLNIIKSVWGQKFVLTKLLTNIQRLSAEDICNEIYKKMVTEKCIDLDNLLDYNMVDKNKAMDVMLYLLLKACTLHKASIDDVTAVLDILLEFIETKDIVLGEPGNVLKDIIKVGQRKRIPYSFINCILKKIIETTNIRITKPWCNICESPETVLCKRLFEICLTGCSIESYRAFYFDLLQMLLKKFCSNGKETMEFIANIACGHILYAHNPKDVVSPELQTRCLNLMSSGVSEAKNWIYDSDVVFVMILFNLNHPVTFIRTCTVNFMEIMLQHAPSQSTVYIQLLKELLEHKEELLLDREQIYQVLNIILTQTPNKVFKKNCLNYLTRIITGDFPAHISSELLKLLVQYNNSNFFSQVAQAGKKLQSQLKCVQLNEIAQLDIYQSKLLKHLFQRIDESTISVIEKEYSWNLIDFFMKEYREVVIDTDQSSTSPALLVIKQINEDVFKKVPEGRRREFVSLITAAGSLSNNPNLSSAASKTMKKIYLNFLDFSHILEAMLNAADPGASAVKKNKSTTAMISYQLTETNEWKMGVTLLEYVQSKKKMSLDNSFVVILFQILKRCLRFEEQSYVEYTKQLILSSLWYFCRKFVNDADQDQVKNLKSVFNIELVVQCIRGTQNPQTHHHALILLSHAAYMLPEQVLHHTMEIFTFMGSSVLRHDDAYSFQIITKIIETLIPILVKLDKNVDEYSEKEIQKLQDRVVPVLRIFADVVLHVPEHRRIPLYKKLIETLGPNHFLWVFLALLLEAHISHWNENKDKTKNPNRSLAEQELPINRLDFGLNIVIEFSPEIILETFENMIKYIKSLPLQKDENSMDLNVQPNEIFSINGHSAVQLRHYKYVLITFINTCMSSTLFIQLTTNATDTKVMEAYYKSLIINTLTFIQSITKITDEKTLKYWRVMLHYCYDLLDHVNNLLSAPMFLSVIKGLLKHTLQTVRRKSMELLNSKIQFNPEFFADCDKEHMFMLLTPLLDIVKTIESRDESVNDAAQELELNQQTALLSLKLLTRFLAVENPEPFKPVLEQITDYTCNPNISGNVMASVVLCLSELCSNLKAHALTSLRKFMPALIKVLKKQRKVETPELVLLSTVTAISKIIESLPLFLSPYMEKILYEYSILLAKWQDCDQDEAKVSAIVSKLVNIKKKIATSIPPRVLIPVVNQTHQLLLEKQNYVAIGPVMSVLAESFKNVTTADFTALQQDLTTFFLSSLQLRCVCSEEDVNETVIDKAEDEVVNALVCLVLKLSETSFRPFYFKIYDWAIRSNVDGHRDRAITFYRLSSAIADKLKGLFVLFAGHFIKNAADLLDSCNKTKTEDLFFDTEEKCAILVEYIFKTLQVVFRHDSQSFINKERFETLMQPMVDQLENTLMGVQELRKRSSEVLVPCISQFAVAIADDSLWKLLNYQILLKTRHNDSEIRLLALDCLISTATQLGSGWLPLLAESVPFLAELLEDGDQKIEVATKNVIRSLEEILGEPLEKYF